MVVQAACRALYPSECNGDYTPTAVAVAGETLTYNVELYCVELLRELVDVHVHFEVLYLGEDDLLRAVYVHPRQVDDVGLDGLGVRLLGLHDVRVGHVHLLVRQVRLGFVQVVVGRVHLCGLGRQAVVHM